MIKDEIRNSYTYRLFKFIGKYWKAFDDEYEKMINKKYMD